MRKAAEAAQAKGLPDAPLAQVLNGILQRMEDIMGPGAVYSLVHYSAFEEGLRLAAQSRPAGVEPAVQAVARLLGIEGRVQAGHTPLRVLFRPTPQFGLQDRGSIALLIGLLEGMLTGALGSKVAFRPEASLGGDGWLPLDTMGDKA